MPDAREYPAMLKRMKKVRPVPHRSFVLLLFALVSVGFVWFRPALAAGKVFRAGAYVVDISPTKLPVIVNAMFTERTASAVVDRLYVRALALDDGSTVIVLCIVDTCMMPRDLIDRAKEQASRQTGLPTNRMLVSATHTHSAPSAMGCLGSRVDPDYAASLPPKIAEAIAGAHRNLEPARVGWGTTDDWEHTFNRRWIRRPDRILNDPFGNPTARAHMHPGHQSPDAIGPSGPVDPGLSILSVQSRGGRPLALLANYSQHYYGSPLLSADYFGRFSQHVGALISASNPAPAFVGMMSQGTSGDLMWMDYGSPPRDIGYDAYAREMAQRAFSIYHKIKYQDWVPLKMAERTLALDYRVPDEARLTWARKVAAGLEARLPQTLPEIYALEAVELYRRRHAELKLQALRIGDLGIAALPNEVFAITGLKLKAQSPLQPTFNVELANGAEGYIPPPEQHKLGGYTTWPARTAGLEPQAEPKIVETLLSLLEEVSGRPRRIVPESHGPYARAVLRSRPVAYWRLDEMVVPAARDASGRGNHGTYEDGIALYLPGVGSGDGVSPNPRLTPSKFSGGQVNRAAHFCGGRLRAAPKGVGNRYAVELWFWNGLPVDARGVTGHLVSAANGDRLGLTGTDGSPGRLFFALGASTPVIGRTEIPRKMWTHAALIRDGRKVTVYLNGDPHPEILAETASPARGDGQLFVGGSADNTSNFEGKIDEVALFSRPLKSTEVVAHARASGLFRPGAEKQ
jgi:hypothetical protein